MTIERIIPATGERRLVLPLPPSVNSYWTGRGTGGQRMRSKRARAYLYKLLGAVRVQGSPSFGPAPVVITMHLHHSHSGGDIDNYTKGVFDGLTHAGVWDDDDQVIRMQISKRGRVAKGLVVIDIRAASSCEIERSALVMAEADQREQYGI